MKLSIWGPCEVKRRRYGGTDKGGRNQEDKERYGRLFRGYDGKG